MYTLIDSDAKLTRFRNRLKTDKVEILSMDFEGEFNLHRYGERLCLIQIYDGSGFFIVDPFRISDGEIKDFLESGTVKIFFDARSDRSLVFKQYGARLNSVLDLRHMVEALDLERKSLDAVLAEMLGIQPGKKGRFQRYNWTLRPVKPDALEYALNDVKHLFALKEALISRIEREGLVSDLVSRIARTEEPPKNSIPSVKKKNEYRRLSDRQRRIFDEIFELREDLARELDRPPHFVLPNRELSALAKGNVPARDAELSDRIAKERRMKFLSALERILNE